MVFTYALLGADTTTPMEVNFAVAFSPLTVTVSNSPFEAFHSPGRRNGINLQVIRYIHGEIALDL